MYISSLIGFPLLLSALIILLLLLRGAELVEPDQHNPTHITDDAYVLQQQHQQQEQEGEEVIVAGQDTCLVSVAWRKCSNKEVINRY